MTTPTGLHSQAVLIIWAWALMLSCLGKSAGAQAKKANRAFGVERQSRWLANHDPGQQPAGGNVPIDEGSSLKVLLDTTMGRPRRIGLLSLRIYDAMHPTQGWKTAQASARSTKQRCRVERDHTGECFRGGEIAAARLANA